MREARFLKTWLVGYWRPSLFVNNLKEAPAPHWGVYAQVLRGLMDATLLYLPLALMGRQPSTPSYLAFIPTSKYYLASILIAPIFIVCQWLLAAVIQYLVLRLSGRPSDMDLILNITGMAALVVGAFLIVWDWIWIIMGWENVYLLGVSHLLLDIWGIVITTLGFKRLLSLPTWLAITISLLGFPIGIPLAVLFMRGPF